MAESLQEFVGEQVIVATNDGGIVTGILRGFDQNCSLIIEDAKERVFTQQSGVEEVPLGLDVIRGDNLSLIGLFDEEKEKAVNWDEIKGEPLLPIVH